MALKGNTHEEQIWNFLKADIGNDYGAAGLMGNLYAESGLNPKNLENLCEKRLKEAGKPYFTDDTYTAAVDSGKIDRAEFLNPLPGCNAALYSRRKKHFIFDGINTITALSFR